jgi:hypothetical protein
MRVFRALLIATLFIFLLLFGGPVVGLVISGSVFTIPILFVLAILVLAGWKIRDLIER